MDNTAWGMRLEAFEEVFTDIGIPATEIQLEVYSQAYMKKANMWFSLYNAAGSARVDGFYQRWANADGTRALCWVDTPFYLMGRIIRKWEEEKLGGILAI